MIPKLMPLSERIHGRIEVMELAFCYAYFSNHAQRPLYNFTEK